MRRIIVACLFCTFFVQPALAGAWLREKGKGFTSISTTIHAVSPVPSFATSIYADYGLFERLSVGLDLYIPSDSGGHVLLFARLPLPIHYMQLKYAVELGLGAHLQGGNWYPMYRASLSMGKGFSTRYGNGWMAADTTVEYRTGGGAPIFKVDATIGLSAFARFNPMLQLETAIGETLPLQVALASSVMISTKGKSTWVIGVQHRFTGIQQTSLKLSIWRRF